ncbi:MAG: hypothetical protein KDB10_08705 [Acidimicrobiales bacterium]|nr:hypothetical protein [Acidimicrobiales bacterium]MCB9371429.1 hypothetical protein [Microthrixaceae bacterium]
MTTIDDIQRWAALAGFGFRAVQAGPPFRVLVSLEDDGGLLAVTVDGPVGPEDPLRLRYRFDLAGPMETDRLVRLLDAAVMQRSAMVDARPAGPDQVDMVVALYPDGVTRHAFMTGVFECQKLRRVVRGEVEGALASEAAMASLTALADASDRLSDAIEAAVPSDS